jgi:hypothetical protein
MNCPVCVSAIGMKTKEELVMHLNSHKTNPDLLIDKFAHYIIAKEG